MRFDSVIQRVVFELFSKSDEQLFDGILIMIYGYCSTTKRNQNLDSQIKKIRESYPDATIIESTPDQPVVLKLISKQFMTNDEIIVTDILKLTDPVINFETGFDSICESIIENYESIFAQEADIVILSSPVLNSQIYRTALSNKATSQSLGAVSSVLEEQIKIIVRQQYDSIMARNSSIKSSIKSSGKRRGLKLGTKLTTRKEIESKAYMRTYLEDFGGSQKNVQVMAELGLARNTFYKYKREIKAELEQGLGKEKPAMVEEIDAGGIKKEPSE